jgi:hypothetical protein
MAMPTMTPVLMPSDSDELSSDPKPPVVTKGPVVRLVLLMVVASVVRERP